MVAVDNLLYVTALVEIVVDIVSHSHLAENQSRI